MALSDERIWAIVNQQCQDMFDGKQDCISPITIGRAIESEARRDALEEAAKKCEAMHEEDRPGDYAYAIRALKESPPPTA